MQTAESKRYLTPQQVATKLGVNRQTVNDWCESGIMPALNLARSGATKKRWRMSLNDLREFEQRRSSQPVGR